MNSVIKTRNRAVLFLVLGLAGSISPAWGAVRVAQFTGLTASEFRVWDFNQDVYFFIPIRLLREQGELTRCAQRWVSALLTPEDHVSRLSLGELTL